MGNSKYSALKEVMSYTLAYNPLIKEQYRFDMKLSFLLKLRPDLNKDDIDDYINSNFNELLHVIERCIVLAAKNEHMPWEDQHE